MEWVGECRGGGVEWVHGGVFLLSDELAGYAGECEPSFPGGGGGCWLTRRLTDELRCCCVCVCLALRGWVLVHPWAALLHGAVDAGAETAAGDADEERGLMVMRPGDGWREQLEVLGVACQ